MRNPMKTFNILDKKQKKNPIRQTVQNIICTLDIITLEIKLLLFNCLIYETNSTTFIIEIRRFIKNWNLIEIHYYYKQSPVVIKLGQCVR